MFSNTDTFNFFFLLKQILINNNNMQINPHLFIVNDLITTSTNISNTIYHEISDKFSAYLWLYLDTVYSAINTNNLSYFLFKTQKITHVYFPVSILFFINFFFKCTLFFYIIITIYFVTNLENYIKQILNVNILSKLMILNATEKEVGPVDDYFFFAVLFFLTISIFIFSAIFLIIIQSNIFIWAIGGFFLLTLLILSIPVNLFIDFGIVFCTVIRGSASSNNIIKELIFDIISTTTVFIRFIIQNIRFLFIFAGIFELLEWTITNNNSIFLSSCYNNENFFINSLLTNSFTVTTSFNYLIINTILFILLYFYYILHLLFLLLVQITVYLGISIWLFFFLYSTKFLNKFDKYLLSKKLNN